MGMVLIIAFLGLVFVIAAAFIVLSIRSYL